MAFNGGDRHFQYLRDLRGVKFLLVAQDDDQPRLLRKRRHHTAQKFGKQWIGQRHFVSHIRHFIKADLWTKILPPHKINTSVAGGSPQSKREVRITLDCVKVLVKLEKNVLRQLLC